MTKRQVYRFFETRCIIQLHGVTASMYHSFISIHNICHTSVLTGISNTQQQIGIHWSVHYASLVRL